MYYYAIFTSEEKGIRVHFPDWPDIAVSANNYHKAMQRAERWLLYAAARCLEAGEPFPKPRPARSGETAVHLSELVYLKVLLHNKMLELGVSRAELVEGIQADERQAHRLFNVYRQVHLDLLARAFAFLGTPLKIFI